MIFRTILIVVLLFFVARAIWRLLEGVVRGAQGPAAARQRAASRAGQSVKMVADPVCGTFVVPGKALSLTDGSTTAYFCSEKCRAQYQAR